MTHRFPGGSVVTIVPGVDLGGVAVERRTSTDARDAARAAFDRSALLGLQVVLFVTVYYLAVILGLGFRFQGSQIGVTWPANAWLLTALLLTPRARWWIVLSTAGLAHIVAMNPEVPAWRWSWQIVGNSIFTAAIAVALQRFPGLPLHFGSRRQVFAFTGISLAMSGLFAFTTPAFLRSVLTIEPLYDPPVTLLRLTLSNATALLVLTPMVLLWKQSGVRELKAMPARRLLEAAAIFASLLAVS